MLDFKVGLKYLILVEYSRVHVQELKIVLHTTKSSRERPLCDCPKVSCIFHKWAPSSPTPLLLLFLDTQIQDKLIYHWQCGTKITKNVHRIIILMIQRNHKNWRQKQGSRGYFHTESCNMVTLYHHVLRHCFTKIHASSYLFGYNLCEEICGSA